MRGWKDKLNQEKEIESKEKTKMAKKMRNKKIEEDEYEGLFSDIHSKAKGVFSVHRNVQ